MKIQRLVIFTIACLAICWLAADATAGGRHAGSCLLFPNFNTGQDSLAVMTITNTGSSDVALRMVWVDSVFCTPEDQWIELTAGDTFTFIDEYMDPEKDEQGFMYVYAVESVGSILEVDHDYLIGQEMIFQIWPGGVSYALNAVAFNALALDPDGEVALDGKEYDAAPSELYFPRFFGQKAPQFRSKVILINLTGGQFFHQQASVLVYNDNEQVFSSTVYFPCWAEMKLEDICGAVREDFLITSDHDPLELWNGDTNPLNKHKKTGWIRFTGDWAWNPQTIFVIDDPSLYGVLIEFLGGISAADLPWQVEDSTVYNKAILWSTNPWGS